MPIRIATPEGMQAAAAAALARLPGAPGRLIAAMTADDARGAAALQRIWLERRAARGASVAEAAQALQDTSQRSMLLALARQADAALVADSAGTAWELLEPAGAGPCADVWQAMGTWKVFWMEWPGAAEPAAGAAAVAGVAAWLEARLGRPVAPLVVSFHGGRDPRRAAADRWLATLRARLPCMGVELYSPLFFRDGVLQAGAFAAALQREWQKGPLAGAEPILCSPQLQREEFARRWRAEGGVFSGAVRGGAELPAARLAVDAAPATWQATLDLLLALANPRAAS